MALGRRFDVQLNGRGYILSRVKGGRAWHRTGQADTPSRRSDTDVKYGELSDELDHPTVWDDWSGGYGHAYRRTGENTYHWGENVDCRFPRQMVHCQQLIPMSATYSPAHIEGMEIIEVNANQFAYGQGTAVGAGDVFIQGPTWIQRYTPNGLDYVASGGFYVFAFISGQKYPTAKPALFGSYAYFGGTDATVGFWEAAIGTGDSFTATNGVLGFGFETAGNRLWRFAGVPNRAVYVQNCAPNTASGPRIAANWGATITVGNGWDGINSMKALDDQLFVGTPNGVYAGDTSGTFVNVMPEVTGRGSIDNCRDLDVYQGAIVTQAVNGIYTYQPSGMGGIVQRIGPPAGTQRSPLQGVVRSLKSHADWLYGGLWTGSQSHLIAGKPGPNGQWAWHTLQRLPNVAKVRRIYVDGITTSSGGVRAFPPRLWVLTEPSVVLPGPFTATAPIYLQPTPRMNGNPLAPDPSFSPNYVGSARIDLGNVDWGAPSTPKVYRAVEIWADMLLSGYRYADVYYDVDNSGSFTLLGRANSSPKSTLYFSAGEGSYVTGQSIELSLRSFTASAALSPIYRSIVLRGALRPRSVDQITAVVRIADNMRDRHQGTMRTAATMLQELRDLTTLGTPVSMIDLAGAHSYVSVLPPVEENEIWQSGEENPEVAATIRLAVLTYS